MEFFNPAKYRFQICFNHEILNGFLQDRTIVSKIRHPQYPEQMDVPVIVITGKADRMDKVVGLEIGADDYIGKPLKMKEVAARIMACRLILPSKIVAEKQGDRMTAPHITILLVEDNDIDVMGVRRAFRGAQAINGIVVAENGLEALHLLRDSKSVPKPYLILLDLNMPQMNGIEFLREARQDAELHNAIVFVLSTSRAAEDKQQAFGHNISGYIVKDRTAGDFIDAAELLNRYAQVCEMP